MTASPPRDVTVLLNAWCEGDQAALDQLVPLVYAELRRVAHRQMRTERPSGHVLQTTALINEAYLRLIDVRRVRWQNRAHFFAVSARMMRPYPGGRRPRARRAASEAGDVPHVAFDEAARAGPGTRRRPRRPGRGPRRPSRDVDARKSQVVELRYFGGLSVEETAEVLQVSEQTVMRDWRMAKLWLAREFGDARRTCVSVTGASTADRWAEVERLYHAALEREPGGARGVSRRGVRRRSGPAPRSRVAPGAAESSAPSGLARGCQRIERRWRARSAGQPREPLARGGTRLGPYEIDALLGRAAWARCTAPATRGSGASVARQGAAARTSRRTRSPPPLRARSAGGLPP